MWNKFVGEKYGTTKCFCCRQKGITSRDFHAGHIQPERNGGKTTIINLRPICPSCNNSMGTINMKEFIKQHYPENIKGFKRNYPTSPGAPLPWRSLSEATGSKAPEAPVPVSITTPKSNWISRIFRRNKK